MIINITKIDLSFISVTYLVESLRGELSGYSIYTEYYLFLEQLKFNIVYIKICNFFYAIDKRVSTP